MPTNPASPAATADPRGSGNPVLPGDALVLQEMVRVPLRAESSRGTEPYAEAPDVAKREQKTEVYMNDLQTYFLS
jgi:hypothetical protein